MEWRPTVLHPRQRERLTRVAQTCTDADERTRYLIILHTDAGWSARQIAEALGCGERTVTRTRRRWREEGEAGLIDRREDNGERKVDERYLQSLHDVLHGTPRDFGHRRQRWTQRLLITTMKKRTGVKVSRSTMSQALKQINARRGRPKPTVGHLGWPKARKNRRLR